MIFEYLVSIVFAYGIYHTDVLRGERGREGLMLERKYEDSKHLNYTLLVS